MNQNWVCMLFGDVRLHKMYGEEVLCFSRNVPLWETFFFFFFLQLVEYCMDRFTKAEMGLMSIFSRSIWLRRNKFIFENIFTHPQQVYNDSVDSLDDF